MEEKWGERMDIIVDVIKTDLRKETAALREELGWSEETPSFPSKTKNMSFEELIELDSFFSFKKDTPSKTRKSAPKIEKQESTYQKIAQKNNSLEDMFDLATTDRKIEIQGPLNEIEKMMVDSEDYESEGLQADELEDASAVSMLKLGPLIVIEKSASIMADQKAYELALSKEKSIPAQK